MVCSKMSDIAELEGKVVRYEKRADTYVALLHMVSCNYAF